MKNLFGNIAEFDKSKLVDNSNAIRPTKIKRKKKKKKKEEVKGIEIKASTSSISESQCLHIISNWKRHNQIDGESKDVNNIITHYIDEFIYRLIPIPKSLQYSGFHTGKVKNEAVLKKLKIKEKKFKCGVYLTESDFIEKFVNFKDLHDEEREHYAELVNHIQNAQPKIDFETEFVLILHLGIPQAAVVDIEGSFKTANVVDNVLWMKVSYSQWRKWARYNSFVWCIVINKKSQFACVNVVSVPGSRNFPIEYC